MSYYRVERWSDAMRTCYRLAAAVLPAFVLVLVVTRDRYAGYDPVHFRELIQFQHALNSGFTLAIFSISVVVFSHWQAEARNLLLDQGGLGWLSIHGWDGAADQLPQRGLLPISELLGMLAITLACERSAPGAIVFLPICWCVPRSAPCWKTSLKAQPYAFGTIWMLHAAAVMWSGTRWLAIPIELSAIVLSESQMVYAIRRKAEELLNGDVNIMTKRSILDTTNPSRSRRVAQSNDVSPRLFPFSQLGPVTSFQQPSWTMSVWTATVVGWVLFCLTTRMTEFGPLLSANGDKIPSQALIGQVGLFAIIGIGLLRTLIEFEPFVWTPRLNLISRIWLLRPIVWSSDRILLPHALNAALCCIAMTFRASATPLAYAVFAFAEVLILLRCGVTAEEWQLTSDLRLSPSTLSSGRAGNRTE